MFPILDFGNRLVAQVDRNLVGGNPYMTWEVLKRQFVHFARRPVTAKTAVVRSRITGNCRRKTQCDPELIVSFQRTPQCLTLSVIGRRLPSMLPISDVSEMAPWNPQHPPSVRRPWSSITGKLPAIRYIGRGPNPSPYWEELRTKDGSTRSRAHQPLP